MFKKILVCFLLIVPFIQAAFQYDIITYPYDNSNNEGYGGNYFMVKITEGTGSIYIVDKINNLSSMSGNNEVLSKVMSDYGYINSSNELVSGTWDTIITNQYQKNQWNEIVYQTGYKLGDFSEGEMFGVWIANREGTINGSISPWYSAYGSYGLEKKPDAFGTVLAELDFNGSQPVFFGFHGIEGTDFSGQPLPSAFVSLLFGSPLLAFLDFNRRRKRK